MNKNWQASIEASEAKEKRNHWRPLRTGTTEDRGAGLRGHFFHGGNNFCRDICTEVGRVRK